MFRVAVTFKCHVYLLCFIITVLKCREVVVMGMNDNWTVLEVATFATCHTLDLMHIEKNICENVVCTMFGKKNIINV
jgi:hypothetical protein